MNRYVIAIPALNEELNIKKIVLSALSQKEDNLSLAKVIVVSDGSTDKTVSILEGIEDARLKIFSFDKRAGKSQRISEICSSLIDWTDTDFALFLDADTLCLDSYLLKKINSCFVQGVKLVSGNPKQLKPETFFEGVMQVSAFFQERVKKELPRSVFTCHGRILAVHRDLGQKIKIPEYIVGNDAFIYHLNKSLGYKYNFCKNAITYYRMPASFLDFKKQSLRYQKSQAMIAASFGEWSLNEYKLSTLKAVKIVMSSFVRMPIKTILYFCYILRLKIEMSFRSNESDVMSGKWDVSQTTKKL